MQLLSEQGRYPGAGGILFLFFQNDEGEGSLCRSASILPSYIGPICMVFQLEISGSMGGGGFGILFHETIHDFQPDLLFFGFHGLCSLSLRVLLCIGLDAHLAWSYPYRRNLAFGLVAIILFNLLFPQLSLVYLGGFLEGKGGVRGKDCSFPPFSYSPFFCCL